VFFVSPYFDHDAFMHRTMHVLDTSVLVYDQCTHHITVLAMAGCGVDIVNCYQPALSSDSDLVLWPRAIALKRCHAH